MSSNRFVLIVFLLMPAASTSSAEEVLIASEFSNSYHYVDHYEIVIDASTKDIWPALIDMSSWMDELAVQHESGPPLSEGQVFVLYGDPNYRLEIVKLVPERMLVAANLPSSVEGEDSVGIATITLIESEGSTVVASSMVRQYTWSGDGPDPGRERRNSEEYRQLNETLWGNMLSRLKQQVEE